MGKRIVRKNLDECPVCKTRHHDRYMYEPDEEQIEWGYPAEFRVCGYCQAPFVEVGRGHCQEFEPDESKADG